jgi:hypothetical protein
LKYRVLVAVRSFAVGFAYFPSLASRAWPQRHCHDAFIVWPCGLCVAVEPPRKLRTATSCRRGYPTRRPSIRFLMCPPFSTGNARSPRARSQRILARHHSFRPERTRRGGQSGRSKTPAEGTLHHGHFRDSTGVPALRAGRRRTPVSRQADELLFSLCSRTISNGGWPDECASSWGSARRESFRGHRKRPAPIARRGRSHFEGSDWFSRVRWSAPFVLWSGGPVAVESHSLLFDRRTRPLTVQRRIGGRHRRWVERDALAGWRAGC